jgi:hypothetical protein
VGELGKLEFTHKPKSRQKRSEKKTYWRREPKRRRKGQQGGGAEAEAEVVHMGAQEEVVRAEVGLIQQRLKTQTILMLE